FFYFCFFFSSRRRHTRFSRDWSSDVCSSDLLGFLLALAGIALAAHGHLIKSPVLEVSEGEFRYRLGDYIVRLPLREIGSYYVLRSEERRVGKVRRTS